MMNRYVWLPLVFILSQSVLAVANTGVVVGQASVSVADKTNDTLVPENGGVEKERADTPEAIFLSFNGVRYEAIHWGKARGLVQNGGYVSALDEKTGKQKWLVQVYVVHYDQDKEDDKQEVFIRKITLAKNKKSLLIENDHGEQYLLNFKTRSVKKLIP